MLEGVVIDDAGVFNERLPRMGELLQFQPTPRRSRRPDPLRTTEAEDRKPGVTGLRQLHTYTSFTLTLPWFSVADSEPMSGGQPRT